MPVRRRPEPTERTLAGDDLSARFGQRPLGMQRDDASPRSAAMAHAAHHLLPDVAALLECNAMQRIHRGIVRKGIAEEKIDPALGNGVRDAMAMPVFGGRVRRDRAFRRDPTAAELGKPRIEGASPPRCGEGWRWGCR